MRLAFALTMLLLSALVLAVACGGSADRRAAIQIYASRTVAEGSAHISVGYPTEAGEGDLDLAHDRARIHALHWVPGGLAEVLLVGRAAYFKISTGKNLSGWCPARAVGSTDRPFGIQPTAVLASLRAPAKLHHVATETVRGVSTTHYRITGAPTLTHVGTPTDLWVDGDDHLRRIAVSSADRSQPRRVIIELYDFGVSFPPITAPNRLSPTPCLGPQ